MNSVVTQRFIRCHNKLKEEKRVRSSRQFALSLDYLPQSLSEILKGRRDVTIELLRKAVETYKLNPIYLCTGEGPLFMSESGTEEFRVLSIVTDGEGAERILHVPVPAQAGYASELGNPEFINELPSYTLPDYKYKSGTHRSFDVAGDSMEPTLYEGDKVICSYVEPDSWLNGLKDHYVYVLVTKGDVLVKRVRQTEAGSGRLELMSDNSFYDPFLLQLSDLREVWHVRSKISPFLPAPQHVQRYLLDEVQQLKQTVAQQNELIRQFQHTIEKMAEEDKSPLP